MTKLRVSTSFPMMSRFSLDDGGCGAAATCKDTFLIVVDDSGRRKAFVVEDERILQTSPMIIDP
jgi:hypothetical protein